MRRNAMRPRSAMLFAFALVLVVSAPVVAEDSDKYSPAELEEIVAPIALYPDVVLSSVLPAATVPTDVVQAARWVSSQTGEITEPPADSGWDSAVEALVQFPDVLSWMSENLDWMDMLGYAVAVQQADVLQAIQDYRAKAQDAGNLQSNEQVQIVQEGDVIYVQPAQPTVVYVPTYDPVAVIRPGYVWPAAAWGAGFAMGALGAWAWHDIHWGGHGGHGEININRNPQFNFNNNGNINTGNIGSGNRWSSVNRPTQRPATRPGANRPGQMPRREGTAGRPGQGGVKPGGARPGTRPGSRPGSRPGDRPGGIQRPSTPPSRPGSGATRPAAPPSRPGGATRPSTPPSRPGGATRPGTRPSRPGGATTRPAPTPQRDAGTRSMMGGSSNNGRATQRASDRGRSSTAGSRGGASRGGGARGGGARGGRR